MADKERYLIEEEVIFVVLMAVAAEVMVMENVVEEVELTLKCHLEYPADNKEKKTRQLIFLSII